MRRFLAEQLPSGTIQAFGPVVLGSTAQTVTSHNRAFRYVLVSASSAQVQVGLGPQVASGQALATVSAGATQLVGVGLQSAVWLYGPGATVEGFFADAPIGALP